ncbi:glycerol-3-phosphate acyltransferase [Fibrobacterales bacterium]|nr:glycerol-3-phosphate acyltransferase [Fibrobacterales bacterium]
MSPIFALPIAYLLGSIPTAVWVSRAFKGIDIRDHGSKNAGLTNVFRVLGWKPALPVVAVDLAKGFFAPFIALQLNAAPNGTAIYSWLPIAAGMLAILGHSLTCFAGFRGGKGVLTALGVFLALSPAVAISCFAFWLLLLAITKYVSVASIGACLLLAGLSSFGFVSAFANGLFATDIYVLILSWLVAIFVIYKHKANMVRLWNGTENGFGNRRKK